MQPLFPGFVQVTVQFRPRRETERVVQLAAGATVADLLRAVGHGADSTLVVRGRTPIPESVGLVDGETVTLLSAFSGG